MRPVDLSTIKSTPASTPGELGGSCVKSAAVRLSMEAIANRHSSAANAGDDDIENAIAFGWYKVANLDLIGAVVGCGRKKTNAQSVSK